MSKSIVHAGIDLDKIIAKKRKIEVVDFDKLYEDESLIINDKGFYSFENNYPPILEDLLSQVKLLFDLNQNIEKYKISVYPPALCVSKDVHTIEKTELKILTRVIICIGHRESFDINVSAGGKSASANYNCMSGDAFQICSGSAPGTSLNFDDTTVGKMPPRKGFRNNNFKKNPILRSIVVIDPVMDEKYLAELMTKK